MMLLSFLLIPVALTTARYLESENYALEINNNILKDIRIIGKSPDELNISNLGLYAISKKAFAQLSDLKTLNLANNSLEKFPALANLPNLENLNLANNDIVSGKFYVGLTSLKILNISNNPLKTFEPGHFFGLTKFANILTQGVDILSITSAMFENPETIISRPPFTVGNLEYRINEDGDGIDENENGIDEDEDEYDTDEDDDNVNLSSQENEIGIKVCIQNGHLKSVEVLKNEEFLPKGCQEIEFNDKMLTLNNMGIRTFENGWYRLQDQNVTIINLDDNEIAHFTKDLLNDLPAGILEIYLVGNKIEKLEKGIIENSNKIDQLDLSNNRISEIEDGALEKLNLSNFLILDNNRLKNTKFLDSLPPNIQSVSLDHNEITEISSGDFSKFTQFKNLTLRRNDITEINAQTLRGFSSLMELLLSTNNLQKIESGAFKDLKNLLLLELTDNELSSLEKGVFTGLGKITQISLDNNKLTEIPNDLFADLSNSLEVLWLNDNEIKNLKAGTFSHVPTVWLELGSNKISRIEKGTFNLPNLKVLNLDDNLLEDVEGDSFEGLENLASLSLIANNITTIKKGLAKNLSNLYALDLSQNPINILENGALFGLSKDSETIIHVYRVPLEIIQGGLFDDV